MYGYVAKYRYENTELLKSFSTLLPLDEFLKGNFSQGAKIIDAARTCIQQCFLERQKKYIGEHATIRSFIESELVRCLQEKKALEIERADLQEKIKPYTNKIKALEKYCQGNKIKQAILKKFAELDYKIENMCDFMDSLQHTNKEHYDIALNDYKEMSVAPEYMAFTDNSHTYKELIAQKKENTEKLSHKRNLRNMEKQVAELENGNRYDSLLAYIWEDVGKVFQKIDATWRQIDERDLETIYKETLYGRLVINRNTPKNQRQAILTNISDKVWLFHYLNELYNKLSMQEHLLKVSPRGKTWDEIRREKFDVVMSWIQNTARDINQQVWFGVRTISEGDLTHIEGLFRGPKNSLFDKYVDKIVKNFFTLAESHHETTDLEDKFTELWNYDFRQIDHDKQWLIQMCSVILDNMSAEEREQVADYDAQKILGPYVRQKKENNPQINIFNEDTFDGMIRKEES